MANILIAEDDRISQKLAATIVRDMGHTAFISPDGLHAYDALKAANDFDVLITDIMMPRMDGRQLIQTLRGDQEFMDLPIIIMSAVVGVGDIAELLDMGATLFLAKPLDKKDVMEYVVRSLKHAKARQERMLRQGSTC